jgi:hypothetical protein
MLSELMNNINLDGSSESPSLSRSLNAISATDPHRLLLFVNSQDGKELVSKLLALANSPDEHVSALAAKLREGIQAAALTTGEENVDRLTDVTIENIRDSILEPTSEHLS